MNEIELDFSVSGSGTMGRLQKLGLDANILLPMFASVSTCFDSIIAKQAALV